MKQIKIKGKRVYKKALIDNILDVYWAASSNVVAEGYSWYRHANNLAITMSKISGLKTFQCAGIIAALSPLSSWEQNKKNAIAYAEGRRTGLHTKAMMKKCEMIEKSTTFEEVWDVLNGDKIKSFALNILDYGRFCSTVTIDRHAIGVAYGKVISDKDRPQLTARQYEFISDAYIQATKQLRAETSNKFLLPQELQAITWVQWRIYNEKVDANGI